MYLKFFDEKKKKGNTIFNLHRNVQNKNSLSINKVNFKSNVPKMLTALKDTVLSLLNE